VETSEQAEQGTKKSLPGLLESASERVQSLIEAAESSAAGILEDARQEARRYADEARKRVDEVSRERTKRVGELTDELNALGEDLMRQAEEMRAHAQALTAALTKATNDIYSDLAEHEQHLDSLEGEDTEIAEDLEADLDADDSYGIEPGPAFDDDEGTLPLEEEPEALAENGQPADRRKRPFGLFRRREEEPGTSEIAVIDEAAEGVDATESDESS
jgi:cell division septum initiation protein DivIVA